MKNYLLVINYKHFSAYIPEKYFIKIFNTNNNWKQIEADKYNNDKIDFLYNSKSSNFYNTLSDIGNIFQPYHLKYLTNKYNLYKTLQKL
jgi:hypothetical protein